MIDDLSEVIGELANITNGSPAVVTRAPAPTWVNGIVTPGATSTLNITGSFQPTTGQDLKRLPEGDRSSEAITIFTATPLHTASVQAGTAADLVAVFGKTYQVEHVELWGATGNYCKAIARRVGQ